MVYATMAHCIVLPCVLPCMAACYVDCDTRHQQNMRPCIGDTALVHGLVPLHCHTSNQAAARLPSHQSAEFPPRRQLPVSVRRGVSASLLTLTTKCPGNQDLMLQYDQLCNTLFTDFLPTCGDYNTQVRGGWGVFGERGVRK